MKTKNSLWLIWCHERNQYWMDNEIGYTSDIELAGRYIIEDAIRICNDANVVSLNESMIPAPTTIKFNEWKM